MKRSATLHEDIVITKREVLRRIDGVKRIVEEELGTNGSRIYGRGLSNEAFAGGYEPCWMSRPPSCVGIPQTIDDTGGRPSE
jgi:hypothetical protein